MMRDHNLYYSPEGKPCSQNEWLRYWSGDNKVVKQERTAQGYFVSTVYLGLDHQWGDGPPLIFESMVFPGEGKGELGGMDQLRYASKDEALRGHEVLVNAWGGRNRTRRTRFVGSIERLPLRITGRYRYWRGRRMVKRIAKGKGPEWLRK